MRANTAEPSRRRGEGEGAREREGEREPKRRTVAVVTAVALRGKIGLACKVQQQREWVTKQQWGRSLVAACAVRVQLIGRGLTI